MQGLFLNKGGECPLCAPLVSIKSLYRALPYQGLSNSVSGSGVDGFRLGSGVRPFFVCREKLITASGWGLGVGAWTLRLSGFKVQ